MRKMSQEEVRTVQMDILDEVARICKDNNIQYYLAFGSLLGAVRHKGYIPWDDDIDICVVRDDYEKLLEILKSKDSDKKEYLSVVDNKSKDYFYPFAKVVDDRTKLDMERHTGSHGVWIDIFPLDGVTDSFYAAKFHMGFCAFLRVVALAMDANFAKSKIGFDWFYKRLFNAMAHVIGMKRFCRIHEWFFKFYKVKDSKYIANLFTNNGTRSMMDKEKLLKVATYSFEDRAYEGYAEYDYYLKRMYGDYMKLPPMEKRITHAFDAWWKD